MKQTRRQAIGTLIAGAAALGGVKIAGADSNSQLPASSLEAPRSGPLGPSDAMQTLASERPIAMVIPDANVDSEVEINHIVDGQMLNPTGPWVVSWYEGTGLLHEKRRNMLYSGHVDYWDVGPAIFWTLASVPEGTHIQVLGDKGGQATYAVEFIERVTLAELTAEKMQQITAPTPYEALTIITCGGEFDYSVGQYLQRDIVRARLVQGEEAGESIGSETEPAEETTSEETTATEEATAAAENGASTATATVTENFVNVRTEASTTGSAVAAVNQGDTVTITGDPIEADGYTWYPVQLEDGTTGFVASNFLEIAP